MHSDEIRPETTDDRERQPNDPAPRGNPETDREAVEKGEQQLDKISGN